VKTLPTQTLITKRDGHKLRYRSGELELNDTKKHVTDFFAFHWGAAYICCLGLFLSTFVVDKETFLGLLAWLAWFFPTTITCGVALLIASVWRPARLFTGIALILTSLISFCALVIATGSMIYLIITDQILFFFLCILPPAPFFVLISGILTVLDGQWKISGIVLGWTLTTITFAKLGDLLRLSGQKWLKEVRRRRLQKELRSQGQKASRKQIQTIFQD
jgi:hypothetical protein